MKKRMNPLASAFGVALVASVAGAPGATASASPFQIAPLASGYNLAEAGKTEAEGKCGAGKGCEGKDCEGGCGSAAKGGNAKTGEGKCGEGKCGEGKCGEGKCGAGKAPAPKTEEGKCGGKTH